MKNEEKPKIMQTQACKNQLVELKEGLSDYQWKMRQLKQATKKQNTEAVISMIDNKYMPAWQENKSMQINRLQAQVERLKATSEAMKDQRPSNSDKPVPIKLQAIPI